MWYVYILKSKIKPFIYIGSTNNLKSRLKQHNRGENASTKPYIPLEIEAYISVKTEKLARNLEKYFKTGSGKAFLHRHIIDK